MKEFRVPLKMLPKEIKPTPMNREWRGVWPHDPSSLQPIHAPVLARRISRVGLEHETQRRARITMLVLDLRAEGNQKR
jgi:hypothetical protein